MTMNLQNYKTLIGIFTDQKKNRERCINELYNIYNGLNLDGKDVSLLVSETKKYFSGYYKSGKITKLLKKMEFSDFVHSQYDRDGCVLKELIREIEIFLKKEKSFMVDKHKAQDWSELFSVF
jgi:hypothetical protein